MTLFLNNQHRVRIFWRLLFFVVLTFAINIPLQLLLQALLPEGLTRGYISATLFFLSILISLYVQARFLEKTSFEKYGLHIDRNWLTEFFVGCGIAAVQLVVFYGTMSSLGYARVGGYFMIPPDANYSFSAGFLSELFSQLIGSVGEEIFFRAFLFYLILESLRHFKIDLFSKALLASLITALLFGLAHYTNENATLLSTANLVMDGVMLAIPFLITGRLGMSIGIHFAWNLLTGAVLGAGVSGTDAKVSAIQILLSDNLFTGGAFGPEGSVLIVLLDSIAVGITFLWWKAQKQESILSPRVSIA